MLGGLRPHGDTPPDPRPLPKHRTPLGTSSQTRSPEPPARGGDPGSSPRPAEAGGAAGGAGVRVCVCACAVSPAPGPREIDHSFCWLSSSLGWLFFIISFLLFLPPLFFCISIIFVQKNKPFLNNKEKKKTNKKKNHDAISLDCKKQLFTFK